MKIKLQLDEDGRCVECIHYFKHNFCGRLNIPISKLLAKYCAHFKENEFDGAGIS